MAQDYDKLGLQIDAVDNASKKLQNIVNLLSQIEGFSSSGTSVGVKSDSNTIQNVTKTTQAIQKQTQSVSELTNKYLSYDNTLKRVENAERSYATAQNQAETARINLQNATLKYENALQRVSQLEEKLANTQSISKRKKLQEQLSVATNNLTIAENNYGKAYLANENAMRREMSALNSLNIAKTNSQKASNNLALAEEKLQQKTEKSSKSFVNFAAKLGTIYYTVRKVATAVFNTVKVSGEFVENLNLFGVTFGENYDKTLDWALEFADNLGVASSEIVRFTGLFKQLATSIGIADETGDLMSKTLTQLGYDLASLYDISTETAFEKLQAGIFSGKVLPHNKVIYYANSSNLWELFGNKDNHKQRLDMVA